MSLLRCGARPKLTDSAAVYDCVSYGMIYFCRNYPQRDSFVGVHKGTMKPLGRMANPELRRWKKIAADLMSIDRKRCHIGMFDVPECKKVYAALKDYSKK